MPGWAKGADGAGLDAFAGGFGVGESELFEGAASGRGVDGEGGGEAVVQGELLVEGVRAVEQTNGTREACGDAGEEAYGGGECDCREGG